MNKTIYIRLASLTLLGASLGSCSDFLDPEAKSEFVPKDAQALNELLLGEAYPTKTGALIDTYLGLLDDDVTCAPYQVPAQGTTSDQYLAVYSWQGDMWTDITSAIGKSSLINTYKGHYDQILGCNAVIDYISQVSDTPENINNVLAQAYALRAFYYLHLVNIYGQPYQTYPDGMGIPLKLNSGIEIAAMSRSTVREVYEQIVSDLLEAESLYKSIPEDMQWKARTFRTSLPMVQLLLSRTYLYMEEWDKAAQYAEAVMNNTNFSYVDLRPMMDTFTDAYGRRTYPDFQSYDVSPEIIWPYGNIDDCCKWLTIYTQTNDQRYIHSYFRASDELLSCFDDNDLRKTLYIIGSWYTMPGTITPMPQAIGKVYVNAYFVVPSTSQDNYGRSLRLSEATLNYAEAKANMPGGDTDALRAINEMRKYRFENSEYKEITAADCQDGVLAFVRDERRRELCYEGQRWFDLRRWGMPEIKHVWYSSSNEQVTYTLSEKDPSYTMPIPTTSLEKNPDLKQCPLGPTPRTGIISAY